MDRCDQISANVKMEECYAGMSLTFDGSEALRAEIEAAIEKIKQETRMEPQVFDNSKDHTETKQALYIEFDDDAQRDSGDFFEKVLKELKIDKCANDVIER
ncbi:MAG: hypothetical protein ACP5D3_05515 [Sulfurovum sp.]